MTVILGEDGTESLAEGKKARGKEEQLNLEINVRAGEEELVELGISLDVLPLASPVLEDSGAKGFLFLRRPLLLRIPHPPSLSQLLFDFRERRSQLSMCRSVDTERRSFVGFSQAEDEVRSAALDRCAFHWLMPRA